MRNPPSPRVRVKSARRTPALSYINARLLQAYGKVALPDNFRNYSRSTDILWFKHAIIDIGGEGML